MHFCVGADDDDISTDSEDATFDATILDELPPLLPHSRFDNSSSDSDSEHSGPPPLARRSRSDSGRHDDDGPPPLVPRVRDDASDDDSDDDSNNDRMDREKEHGLTHVALSRVEY